MTLLKHILIVDDDEDILYGYSMLLENEKTVIFTATSAKEALRIVKKEKIDIAILDYMMPNMRGPELATKMNEINPSIKIYFVSGWNEAVDAVKKLNLPVHGVYMKPIDPIILEYMINEDPNHIETHHHSMNLYSNIKKKDYRLFSATSFSM